MADVARRLVRKEQRDAYSSPWPLTERLWILVWRLVCVLFFRPTPKHLYGWRVLLLRFFGASIKGHPFVAATATINRPWNLVLEDRACIGERAEIYNLATVTLHAGSTVAQRAYLCCGTHDFSDPSSSLMVGDITVGKGAFLGAMAFVLPGVNIGEGAVVGACALVTKDVEPWTIVGGNPAKFVKRREFKRV